MEFSVLLFSTICSMRSSLSGGKLQNGASTCTCGRSVLQRRSLSNTRALFGGKGKKDGKQEAKSATVKEKLSPDQYAYAHPLADRQPFQYLAIWL